MNTPTPTPVPTPTPASSPAAASQPLDRKTFWIGILTLCAAVLLAAHALQPTQTSLLPAALGGAMQESVENRNYAMATAESADGGEVLYVLDKRSGVLGLFVWDPQQQKPMLVNHKPIVGAFQQ